MIVENIKSGEYEEREEFSAADFNSPMVTTIYGGVTRSKPYPCPLALLEGVRQRQHPCRTFWASSGRVSTHVGGKNHPPLPEAWKEAYECRCAISAAHLVHHCSLH